MELFKIRWQCNSETRDSWKQERKVLLLHFYRKDCNNPVDLRTCCAALLEDTFTKDLLRGRFSMFTDSAKVFIRSGNGGNGHVSFRRELYVPNGGPDGGDGGRGGDIIFEVDDGLNTLVDFRHVRKYAAENGEEGGKRRCHGADGKDLIVRVPEGTVVKDLETGKVITDMSGENRREVILKGGKGGLETHLRQQRCRLPSRDSRGRTS